MQWTASGCFKVHGRTCDERSDTAVYLCYARDDTQVKEGLNGCSQCRGAGCAQCAHLAEPVRPLLIDVVVYAVYAIFYGISRLSVELVHAQRN